MSRLCYCIPPLSLIGKEIFKEASKEELRVLLALIERSGECDSVEELAEAACTSRPRCLSALILWEEAGVILKSDTPCQENSCITEEFAGVRNKADAEEHTSKDVAVSIRDEGLAAAIEECAKLMDKAALSTQEVKNICILSTEYALSPEYIITLAAHLCTRGKLTAVRLREEAKRLIKKDVDNVEALERYVSERESETAAEWEYRRAMGIWGRALTPTEKSAFKRWSEELCYSAEIITVAYDAAVSATGKGSVAYMDKLLTAWHAAGCKTAEECKSQRAAFKVGKAAEADTRRRSKAEPEKPRYGDFDINEAFKHALERSFDED